MVVAGGTGPADGGSFINMSNGNQLRLTLSSQVNAAAFGMVYGGVINQIQYNNLIAYCSDNKVKAVISGGFTDVTNTTINIPGHFSDMVSAFDFIRYFIDSPTETLSVNFETGYEPANGLSLIGGDFSHVEVISDDATVTVSPSFPVEDLFVGENCRMPRLNCLIDMTNLGKDGYAVRDGSIGFVGQFKGVINAGVARTVWQRG